MYGVLPPQGLCRTQALASDFLNSDGLIILTAMLPLLDEMALQASVALLMEAMMESLTNPTRAHSFKAATETFCSQSHIAMSLPSTPQRLSELAWVSAPLIKRAEPTPPPPPPPPPLATSRFLLDALAFAAKGAKSEGVVRLGSLSIKPELSGL